MAQTLGNPTPVGAGWQTRSSKTKTTTEQKITQQHAESNSHCKDAETTGQIDINSDHKAGMVRTELPIDHKTQQIRRPTEKKTRRQAETATQPSNTRRTQRQARRCHANSASTTQNEQPHDNSTTTNEHAESLRQLVQKRDSTPHEDRRPKTDTIKNTICTINKRRWETSNFRDFKHTTSIKTRRKCLLITHRQDKTGNSKYDRQGIADVFVECSTPQRRRHTNTRATAINVHA